MNEGSNKKSILMLHMAVMLFGLSGVIAKFVGVSSVMVTFGRVACSSFILLIVMLAKRESFRLRSLKDALILIISGLVLSAHWMTFFQSIKTASVAVGTITFSTFPFFLIFLEPLVFREKFKWVNLIYSAALLIGVAVTVPELSLSNRTTAGILWGMAGSLTYAVLSLLNRHLSGRYSGIKICFFEQLTAAAALLPAIFIMNERASTEDIAGIAVIGVMCTALAFSLFVGAQKKVKAQTAGIISGLETVYSILFALLLLNGVPSAREITGGVIIIGVAVISTLRA